MCNRQRHSQIISKNWYLKERRKQILFPLTGYTHTSVTTSQKRGVVLLSMEPSNGSNDIYDRQKLSIISHFMVLFPLVYLS